MEATPITVVVPISTPRMVRKARNLWLRKVSSASSRFSRTGWRRCCAILGLRPQGFNGFEVGGFTGWIDAEEKPHRSREEQPHQNRAQGDAGGEKDTHDLADYKGDQDADRAPVPAP